MVVDLRRKRLTGDVAAQALERAGIVANMNPIPADAADRKVMSGLRFGVSAATTRGFAVPEFEQIGDWIAEVLSNGAAAEQAVLPRVRALTRRFPIYA
jgi:glycine hydroxymethyltransferase